MSKATSHDNKKAALCPVCSGDSLKQIISSLFVVIDLSLPYNLCHCRNCGHRFISLTSLSLNAIESIYTSEYAWYRHDTFFQAIIREEIATNFISRIPPPGQILDVGCGNGDFLVAAQEFGYIVFGIDNSSAAVAM